MEVKKTTANLVEVQTQPHPCSWHDDNVEMGIQMNYKKYMVCLQKKKFSSKHLFFSRTFLSSNCVSFKTNKTFNVTDCVQVGHAQIIGHFWWQNLFESQRPTIQQESEKNNSICRRPD